jgi:hypothetical protein
MGRPKTQNPQPNQRFYLSFCIDGALVQEIDELSERLAKQLGVPATRITRTDLIRVALREWVERQKSVLSSAP